MGHPVNPFTQKVPFSRPAATPRDDYVATLYKLIIKWKFTGSSAHLTWAGWESHFKVPAEIKVP